MVRFLWKSSSISCNNCASHGVACFLHTLFIARYAFLRLIKHCGLVVGSCFWCITLRVDRRSLWCIFPCIGDPVCFRIMSALSVILLFSVYAYCTMLFDLTVRSLHSSVVQHYLHTNVSDYAPTVLSVTPTPILERKDQYQYVYDTFERNGYKQGKFETHDPGYEVLEWDLNRTVVWNHRSVCTNETFAFVLLFVYATDFERRQLFRQYLRQGMVVHGKKINYMMIMCVEEWNEGLRRSLMQENDVYGDLMISVLSVQSQSDFQTAFLSDPDVFLPGNTDIRIPDIAGND